MLATKQAKKHSTAKLPAASHPGYTTLPDAPLIRPSFVPEAPTQELRALLRTRKQRVREQASHVQRLQETMEDANLKLGSVLIQIMGVSGRAFLQALIDGERDPDRLLTLVQCALGCQPQESQHPASAVPAAKAPARTQKGLCAAVASILTAAYHMLRDGTFYQDLGANHFQRTTPETQANRFARQIAKLGFTCTIAPIAGREVSV